MTSSLRLIAPSAAAALALALLFAGGCATSPTGTVAPAAKSPAAHSSGAAAKATHPTPATNDLAELQAQLTQSNARVQTKQQQLEELRVRFRIHDVAGETPDTEAGAEAVKRLKTLTVEAATAYQENAALQSKLLRHTGPELRRALTNAVPDARLIELLQQLAEAEQNQAALAKQFPPQQHEYQTAADATARLRRQTDDRVDAILADITARVGKSKASVESLHRELETLQSTEEMRGALLRPYLEMKRELLTLETARDTLKIKVLQQEIEQSLLQEAGR